MTIIYQKIRAGRFSYWTDQTKPKPKGKYIAGLSGSLEQIRKSVRKYLGHDDFTLQEQR